MGNSQSKQLETAVKEEKWKKVDSLLKKSNYNSSVLEQFIAACEENDTVYVDNQILSHCTSQQWNRLLEAAVKKERWDDVKVLLSHSNYSSSVVDQFITACEQYGVINVDGEILIHCNTEQRNRLMTIVVKKERWEEVNVLLKDSNYSSSVVDQFITACEQCGVIHVNEEILFCCSKEQLDRLLTLATTLKHWEVVFRLLKAGVSHEKRVWVIEQAPCQILTSADCQSILPHVDDDFLSQCNTQQLDCLLTKFTKKERWKIVDKMLKAGGSLEKRVWVFVEACQTDVDEDFQNDILPHVTDDFLSQCSTQQHARLLRAFTLTSQWNAVARLLKLDVSHEKLWVIEQACENACNRCFKRYILPHVDADFMSRCSTEQLARLQTTAITSERWDVVSQVLRAGGSIEELLRLIEQASETTANKGFIRYILPHVSDDFLSHCNTEQVDSLLETATKFKFWGAVDRLLKAGGSHDKRVFAIERAVRDNQYGHIFTIRRCILPHVTDDLLSQCTTEQVDSLLIAFTLIKKWDVVNKLLKVGGSHERRVWVFTEACNKCDCNDFENDVLLHVDDDFLSRFNTKQLDSLLAKSTAWKRWNFVSRLLKIGGSPHKLVWVIEQACLAADPLDFKRYISPHCDDHMYNNTVMGVTAVGISGPCVFFYAVQNSHKHCQGIVAECIRLGFSTHQPPPVVATTKDIAEAVTRAWMTDWDIATVSGIITSPFLLAVLRGMPVVVHMLYESGACSYTELLRLYTVLLDLSDPHTESGRKLHEGEYLTDLERRDSFQLYSERYDTFMNTLTTFLPYLREMASTPRSLVSTCRLVISHCLNVGERRARAVQELPLTDRMKDYLLFYDLTDPDYQPQTYKTKTVSSLTVTDYH